MIKVITSLLCCILITVCTAQDNSTQEANIQWIFKNLNKTEVVPSPTEQVHFNGTADECFCVDYYICRKNGTIIVDGTDITDPRTKGNPCKGEMEVCCKEEIPKPPQPVEACGQRNSGGISFRITGYNGNVAQFGEFPWMVALLKRTDDDNEPQYQCGGTLIHDSLVLTVVHCVNKFEDKSKIIVRAGEWDIKTTTELYPHVDRNVSRTRIHPQYERVGSKNNFALLVLEEPISLGNHIGTVCLPSIGPVPLNRECYATGWGKEKFGEKENQAILKKIDLPIVARDDCNIKLKRTRLGPKFNIHESALCAGGVQDKDTCTGDGGSPLVCPIVGKPGIYEVTGLVAWGIGCGTAAPGVYSDVAYARSWIDKEIQELSVNFEERTRS